MKILLPKFPLKTRKWQIYAKCFAKRMMFRVAPMDFIPQNAKKMLIKAISKRFVANYIPKKLFGNTSGLAKSAKNNDTQR